MSRLHVDWTRCDGHGACAELLPELLASDEWGFPISRTGERDPEIPRALESRAQHAQRSCPLMALRLVTPAPASGRRL
jgi:ferredoxin